jgi:hypothetical protein
MPRRELPLVDGDEALISFAAQLRQLREKAGSPTYRELSKSAHYSVTVLSEAASGRKLPTIFTLCADAEERAWFVKALVRATAAETSRAGVVIGVRADFYGHCARHPELVDVLQGGQVLVGPMSADELRLAIEPVTIPV